MKNISAILLTSITVLFIGLMIGIYIGTANSHNYINLEYTPTTYSDGAISETASPNMNKININSASEEDLTILPGVGQSIAKRIVEYRQTHGLYYSVKDLLKIKGIGENLFNIIKQYVTVGD